MESALRASALEYPMMSDAEHSALYKLLLKYIEEKVGEFGA